MTDICIYSKTEPATDYCFDCGSPLCSSCGYEKNDYKFCNDCWSERELQEEGKCSECGTLLEAIYEDTHPDGIGYLEVVDFKPCQECEYVED